MDKSSERLNGEAGGNTTNHREPVLKKLSTMGLGSSSNTKTNEKIDPDVTDKGNSFVQCITKTMKKLVYNCDNQSKEQHADCQGSASASADPSAVDSNGNCYNNRADNHLRNPSKISIGALGNEHVTPPITPPVSPKDLNVHCSDAEMSDCSVVAKKSYLDTIHTSPISDCEEIESYTEGKSQSLSTSQMENTDTVIHKCSLESEEQIPVGTTDSEQESSEDPLAGLVIRNRSTDRLESSTCSDEKQKKYCSQQSPKKSYHQEKCQTVSRKSSGGNDDDSKTMGEQSSKLGSATASTTDGQSSISSSHKHNPYMVESQETVENYSDDDDDDDDLLSPPKFLYSTCLSTPNVTTPKKGYAPASASPLTPLTAPSRPDHKSHKGKYKLSLDKLLYDKNRKQKKNEKLARMEADLQEGLQKGGVLQMVAEDSGEDEDDGELINYFLLLLNLFFNTIFICPFLKYQYKAKSSLVIRIAGTMEQGGWGIHAPPPIFLKLLKS